MRVWLYYRLSRDEDKELNSLTNQKKILVDYCDSHGYEIVGESFDDNVSGMHFDRDGIEKIYEEVFSLEKGQIEQLKVSLTRDYERAGETFTEEDKEDKGGSSKDNVDKEKESEDDEEESDYVNSESEGETKRERKKKEKRKKRKHRTTHNESSSDGDNKEEREDSNNYDTRKGIKTKDTKFNFNNKRIVMKRIHHSDHYQSEQSNEFEHPHNKHNLKRNVIKRKPPPPPTASSS